MKLTHTHMLEITHIKFISICFLFVIFMLWLISGEVKKTGEQMRADTSIEKYIPYNPTLPLLQQSEDTKQELIKLFS